MKVFIFAASVVKACEEQDDDNDEAHCALVASVKEIACHIYLRPPFKAASVYNMQTLKVGEFICMLKISRLCQT